MFARRTHRARAGARRTSSGLTLWELLGVLAINATTLAWAIPGIRHWQLDARRLADVNAFVTAIQLSRSEAAKRGRPVVLCQSTDRHVCAASGRRYVDGWMVFVNEDDQRPPARTASEPLLWAYVPSLVGSIASNRPLYEFRPFTWRSTNGTITFCDSRGTTHARAVIVSYTGRPRVADRTADRRPLNCGDLP
jgi:type IV fimbrial biogenesis protein FimT